jgi:hypothetical protein
VNHTITACVFNEAMQTLCPDGWKFDNVLFLVTDVVPYINKEQGLPVSYHKPIYCNGFAQNIAKQQFSKQTSTVFYVIHATTIAKQWSSIFCVVRAMAIQRVSQNNQFSE